MRLDTRTYLL